MGNAARDLTNLKIVGKVALERLRKEGLVRWELVAQLSISVKAPHEEGPIVV